MPESAVRSAGTLIVVTQASSPGPTPARLAGTASRLLRADSSPAQIAAAVVMSGLAGLAIAAIEDPLIAVALLLAAGFIAVGMAAPMLFISLLLLLRPALDGPAGGSIGDIPSANAAGALGMLLVGVGAIAFSGGPKFVNVRVTLALTAVVTVSAVAAAQGLLELGDEVGLDPLAELVRLAALLAIYLLAGNLFASSDGLRKLFTIVAASAAVPAAVGLAELAAGVDPVPGYDIGRINGTFGGPLPFSAFLAVAGLILVAAPRDLMHRALRWLLLGAVLVALVATYSREGWLIFLLGLGLLEWRRRKGVLLAGLAVVALVVALVPNVQERILPADDPTGTERGALDSLAWRFENWQGLLERYGERPLTGWGLKTVSEVNPRRPVTASREGGGYDAHHTGIRALVEGGPLLLAAYLALVVAILVSLVTIVKDRRWPQRRFAEIMLAIWIATAVVAVLSDDPFEETAMMYAMLALTGAVHGAHGAWAQAQPGQRAARLR